MAPTDEDIRLWAEQGDVDGLIGVVRDPSAGHVPRIDAVKALGRIGENERAAFADGRLYDRSQLSAGAANALDCVLAAMRDDDENVQYWAGDAAGAFGEAALEPLMAMRKDPEKWVRNTALLGLHTIGVVDEVVGPLALQAVREGVNDPDPDVSSFAADLVRRVSR